MSNKPYPGDDAIIIAIYDQFGVSMKDAEHWFREAKDQRIAELEAALSYYADAVYDINSDIQATVAIDALSSEDTRKATPKTAAETCGREGCPVTGFYERCEKCSMMVQPDWSSEDTRKDG